MILPHKYRSCQFNYRIVILDKDSDAALTLDILRLAAILSALYLVLLLSEEGV